MNSKKILKVLIGLVIFITLPSLLLFSYAYFKYNEELPQGILGKDADILAKNMLTALDADAFYNLKYIEFTVMNKRHYKWERDKNLCSIFWKDYKVEYDINTPSSSNAYIHSFKVTGEQQKNLVNKAKKYFQNDTFWVVAPYTIFDQNVIRKKVDLINGQKGLLITYTSDGLSSIGGNSYLWVLDQNYKPVYTKMWTDTFPIDGLKASWNSWKTLQSGAQIPDFHKIFLFGITVSNISNTK